MKEKMKALVEFLNTNTQLYDMGTPAIKDTDWDEKYFELLDLEIKAGYTLPDSPTQIIHYSVVNKLEKVEHDHKMLSLAKTKLIKEVEEFLGNHDYLAMCKMDGLTCSLRYENGELVSAETRGNGEVGENVFHNALMIRDIPKKISYQNTLVVDGEIISTYHNFKRFEDKFENCRNFAAGSIRLLDSRECAKRGLSFIAWDIIEGYDNIPDMASRLITLKYEGFKIVPFSTKPVVEAIEELSKSATENSYPIDGIVFKFNDIKYGKALGATSHHFKNAIAFKFRDEVAATVLKDIEWSVGRTGQITPIAIYDPVELEGSTVERASLHNISIMKQTFHGLPFKDQKIEVYKSNMIIPQIYSAQDFTQFTNYLNLPFFEIPKICPVCGEPAIIEKNDGVEVLMCLNSKCEGKLINRLNHFCGKDGLDIKGISKATLEKLIDWEWVNNIIDIFNLKEYRSEWVRKAGFGPKSVDNILNAIEEAKRIPVESFISALGIPLIGKNVAAELMSHFSDYQEFRAAVEAKFNFSYFDGFAESKTNAILNFDYTEADNLFNNYLTVYKAEKEENENIDKTCDGLKFVITGKLVEVKNRNELKALIEKNGGKVVDSISKSTNYLINNDINSTSSKNKEAQKLGIPIISEKYFFENFIKNI